MSSEVETSRNMTFQVPKRDLKARPRPLRLRYGSTSLGMTSLYDVSLVIFG
jgi:hypothetical protein